MKVLTAFVLLAITAYTSGSDYDKTYYGLVQYNDGHTFDIPFPDEGNFVGVTCGDDGYSEVDYFCGLACDSSDEGGSCQGNVCVCRFHLNED